MSILLHSHYTGGGDVRWTCSIRSALLVWGLARPFGHQGKRQKFGAPGSLTTHFTIKIIQYLLFEGSPISSTVHRDVVNMPTVHRLSTSCQSTECTSFLLYQQHNVRQRLIFSKGTNALTKLVTKNVSWTLLLNFIAEQTFVGSMILLYELTKRSPQTYIFQGWSEDSRALRPPEDTL